MLRQNHFPHPKSARRGVAVVFTVVVLTVLVGFAALTLDLGAMYNAKADLQDAADAAAMAAAGAMLRDSESSLDAATAIANRFSGDNSVFGKNVTIAPDNVTFGIARLDEVTHTFSFEPNNNFPNAVRVRVSLADESPNGALPLFFSAIFGRNQTELTASATAAMAARDINLVVDLSGSISFDSQLRSLQTAEVNLEQVWEALPIEAGTEGVGDGVNDTPEGDPAAPNPPVPTGPANPTGAAMEEPFGPSWGWMYAWGGDVNASDYDPATDTGLVYLPVSQDWVNAPLETWLTDVGYTNDEIVDLTSGLDDATWDNRVAVALGLARWDSGQLGGLWETVAGAAVGNGDTLVEDSEIDWLVNYPFNGGSWSDYINNYAGSTGASMLQGHANFQYRFGNKTFVDYLLSRRPTNTDTPELADVPMQPLHAIKDASNYMINLLDMLNVNDQLALTSYENNARSEVSLTDNYATVSTRLNALQAKHYGEGYTNIGGGLATAAAELTGVNARSYARKVIVVLTDGIANVDEFGNTGAPGGQAHALAMATAAASQDIVVHAVSVGAGADQAMMAQLAEIGGGQHFHAAGNIDEYSDELAEIFRVIGGLRTVQLIE